MADVLLVDDEKSIRTTLSAFLQKNGCRVELASNGQEAIEMIKTTFFDLVITDLKMNPVNGLDVIRSVKEINPLTEVVVLTGYGTLESGIEAMKLGAYDYITKPPDLEEFRLLVSKALEKNALATKVEKLQTALSEKYSYDNIVGKSNEMMEVLSMVSRVAPTESTVLISGESGTGKELVARAIHLSSKRKNRPLVVINCGALPENIQESELFGHVRGAFTGAYRDKRGLFQEANGGTLFLDEVGETSPSAQVKLLRFLQDGEIRRVGENDPIYVDVRLLAATNKNLEKAISEGKFREDLYYRLNVIPVFIAPLRKRRDDIPLLANYFLNKAAEKTKKNIQSITPEAMKIMVAWEWPGNVRELENVIERAVILTSHNVIVPEDLPGSIKMSQVRNHEEETGFAERTLEDVEKHYIMRTLDKYEWNQKKTATALGISTTTLWRKLKSYGIDTKHKE